MNPRVTAQLRRLVLARAARRCEYCHLAQTGQEATFHVDHVVPVAAGGLAVEDNLALACVSCSLRKAAREAAEDPETGHLVPIFSPRHHTWRDHFQWQGEQLVGRTPIGRATVAALELNRPAILEIRIEEVALGRHP